MADVARWPQRVLATARLAAMAGIERRVPFWSIDRLERRQRGHLQAMVRHAYETVPFYRRAMDDRGLRPDDVRSAADLARLPLIGPATVQGDPESFLSSAQPSDRYVRLWSGGSTGLPRAVYHDMAALLANAAHGERDRAVVVPLVGRRVGYRETAIVPNLSSAAEVRRSVQARSLIPDRVRIERQELSLLDPPAANARQIEAFRPDVLRGYGSALALLFAHYKATGAPFHRPKVVTFTSDRLPESARRLIEDEFGIPVFGAYESIEAFKIGFECERRQGYHLNLDLYPVRIVDEDGRDVPPGQRGEVVVSNLVNRATVLLNYRLGDLGTLAPDPCPCGRSLPLLASLDGRSDDLFALPSGRVVHPMELLALTDPEIWQYQVVQETPTRFRVGIVAVRGVDRTRLRDRVAARLSAQFVDPVTVEVALVDAVERTAGGKVRPFSSRCGGENGGGPTSGGASPDE